MEQKKKLHPLLIAVIVLIVLMLTLCGVVFGLWYSGRNAVSAPNDAPELPVQEGQENAGDSASYLDYNGKRYVYNKDMYNVLLMGIDSEKNPDEAAGSHDQCDVLVLAALDLKQNKMTLISLSRDIVCDIELVDAAGEHVGLKKTHLALAYAYGDGQKGSCEVTRDAVSNIFYGLPIQSYGAYYLNGIEALNDAAGGVTVNLIWDYPFPVCEGAERLTEDLEGTDVTLNGAEARAYIQMRDENRVDSNELRMRRQKQYMISLLSKVKNQVASNPVSVLKLYDAVDDYVITDLGLSEISYLATQAVGMDFTGDIRSLAGELILNEENMAELHVDQQALYELMLEVFYTPVE